LVRISSLDYFYKRLCRNDMISRRMVCLYMFYILRKAKKKTQTMEKLLSNTQIRILLSDYRRLNYSRVVSHTHRFSLLIYRFMCINKPVQCGNKSIESPCIILLLVRDRKITFYDNDLSAYRFICVCVCVK